MTQARTLADFVSGTTTITGSPTFSGTVAGAGSDGFVHLETQTTTTAVSDIKFGNDVFNTTYDRYFVIIRLTAATESAVVYFRFLDNSESEITGTNFYRYTSNNGSNTNNTQGFLCNDLGTNQATESGCQIFAHVWLPHLGQNDYESHCFSSSARINSSQAPRNDHIVNQLRYDQVTTQPRGMKFYMSSGNIAKAMISVFGIAAA